jgi:hypothetical protein
MKTKQHDNKKNKCCHKSSIMKLLSNSGSENETETETETETENENDDNLQKQNNYIIAKLTDSSDFSDSSDEIQESDKKKINKCEPTTPEFAPLNKTITVYISANGKCFHTNINCIHLNKEKNTKIEIDEEYSKQFLCKICLFSI